MKVNISNYTKKGSQKVDVRIDSWDTFSLDKTLARIILPMLLQLKQRKVGIPSNLVNGVGTSISEQYYFDFMNDDLDVVHNAAEEKWEEILDKMIWSFSQLLEDDWDELYHHGDFAYKWKEVTYINPFTNSPAKGYELSKDENCTHWYDRKGHVLHYQRVQEGLDLFGKYMLSLWV
jgi:hypothetical protein